jgi:hypothetical protein
VHCVELRQLIEEQIRDAEGRPDPRDISVPAEIGWGATEANSLASVLEEARARMVEVQRQRLSDGQLPNHVEQEIGFAEWIGLITPLQARLVLVALQLVALGKRPLWRRLAERCDCHPGTAKRHYQQAVAILQANGRGVRIIRQVEVVRERGTRSREVWIREIHQFGRRSRAVGGHERDPQRRAAALKAPPSRDRVVSPVRCSPMNILLATLMDALATPVTPVPAAVRSLRESTDWPHNLGWAQQRLRRAQFDARSTALSALEAYDALCRGAHLCAYCHTPILVGCRLHGTPVHRNKRFCDDACKQAHHRRRRQAHARRAS